MEILRKIPTTLKKKFEIERLNYLSNNFSELLKLVKEENFKQLKDFKGIKIESGTN